MEMLYVKMFLDDIEILEPLTDEERGRLLMAVLGYVRTGDVPELTGSERILFPVFKGRVDREMRAADELSEQRSRSGKMGGRPSGSGANDGSKKAKKANAFSGKQKKQEEEKEIEEDKDIDIDKDIDTDTDKDTDIDKDTDTDADAIAGCAGGVSCEAIAELYNAICVGLPQVKSLTGTRRRAILARLDDAGGDIAVFREVFGRAAASDFLCGRTADGTGWHASFDWILTEKNWIRISEGYYDNRTPPPGERSLFDAVSDGSTGRCRTKPSGMTSSSIDLDEIKARWDEEWLAGFDGA